MKFVWPLLLALSVLLLIQSSKAGDVDVQEQFKEQKIENKLLNEVEAKNGMLSGDDSADDDEDDATTNENELLITEKDLDAFKQQPELHRLARRLKSFHNSNVLPRNYNKGHIQDNDDEYEEHEAIAEERAIRKRQRVRIRNIQNKIKRSNRNRHVANRRSLSNNNSKKQISLRRKLPYKSKAKNTRQNYRPKSSKCSSNRNGIRGSTRREGNRKRRYHTKSGQKHRRSSGRKSYHSDNKSGIGDKQTLDSNQTAEDSLSYE